MDVFFFEAFEEEAAFLRQYLPARIRAGITWKTIQEYGAADPPAPLISIRTQSVLPLAWASKLAGILSRSTGYDHLAAYRRQCRQTGDLPCGFLPPYCSRAVAEQAMLLWLALLRDLSTQGRYFGCFKRDGLTGLECEGRTLLVVGVGNIGYEVTRIGQGLGMRVFGVDIVEKHVKVNYVAIDQGLAEADIVVCAMNLTADNIGYFDYRRLHQAKPGALFINISRGEIAPARDLLRLLDEGRLGGLGLDVYNCEQELAYCLRQKTESTDSEVQAILELAGRPRVICTPHNAFNTREAVERKARFSIEEIEYFLARGLFRLSVPDGL
ncbi:MAG: hydroxyacid dehydrogenase [Deltaproteobacteria bacterium RIFOXYD12_FULL_57_12]|nr:MAG: hydroxyacid dehydrogenase [Deltaproteobacteria bacterium RIFOXYD12_FULL_57_12]